MNKARSVQKFEVYSGEGTLEDLLNFNRTSEAETANLARYLEEVETPTMDMRVEVIDEQFAEAADVQFIKTQNFHSRRYSEQQEMAGLSTSRLTNHKSIKPKHRFIPEIPNKSIDLFGQSQGASLTDRAKEKRTSPKPPSGRTGVSGMIPSSSSKALLPPKPSLSVAKANCHITREPKSSTKPVKPHLKSFDSSANPFKEYFNLIDRLKLPVKPKLQYTKSDISGLLNAFQSNYAQMETIIDYERQKSESISKENSDLISKTSDLELKIAELESIIREKETEWKGFNDVISNLRECQQVLKESQVTSYVCLQFYKDLDSFIQTNKFDGNSNDKHIQQLTEIEDLLEEHGLSRLDFETDRIEKALEAITEFVRRRQLMERVVRIDLEDEEDKEEQSNSDDGFFKVRVTKINMRRLSQDFSTKKLKRTHSCVTKDLVPRNAEGLPNRHINCGCGGTNKEITDLLKKKDAQLSKLKQKLESRSTRILDLKQQLQRERDQEHIKRRHEEYRLSIANLEKDYNSTVVANAKLSGDVKRLTSDLNKAFADIVRQKEGFRQVMQENQEFKKVVNNDEGFQNLQKTIENLTSLMISKENSSLNNAQLFQLKAIFGDSHSLHKLRQRLQIVESRNTKLSQALTNSVTVACNLLSSFDTVYILLEKVLETLSSYDDTDSIIDYEFMVLKERLQQFSSTLKGPLEKQVTLDRAELESLRSQLSRQSVLEEMLKLQEPSEQSKVFDLTQEIPGISIFHSQPTQSRGEDDTFDPGFEVSDDRTAPTVVRGMMRHDNQLSRLDSGCPFEKSPPKTTVKARVKSLTSSIRGGDSDDQNFQSSVASSSKKKLGMRSKLTELKQENQAMRQALKQFQTIHEKRSTFTSSMMNQTDLLQILRSCSLEAEEEILLT